MVSSDLKSDVAILMLRSKRSFDRRAIGLPRLDAFL